MHCTWIPSKRARLPVAAAIGEATQFGSVLGLIVVVDPALQSSIKHESIGNVCTYACISALRCLFCVAKQLITSRCCASECAGCSVFGFRHLPQINSFDEILKNEYGIDIARDVNGKTASCSAHNHSYVLAMVWNINKNDNACLPSMLCLLIRLCDTFQRGE